MSVNVENIINEIRKGNIAVDREDDYRLFCALGLPHGPCIADDAVTDCLGRNDSASWFR